MVPRPDVVAVEDILEIGAVLERAIEAGYSRIPVFNQSLDDVVGIAFTKDLIRAAAKRQGAPPGERGVPAGKLRPRDETRRPAHARDAGRPVPPRRRHRRVWRHRRRRHARGPHRGARRRDRRRVRRRRAPDRAPRRGPVPGLEQDGRGRGERVPRRRAAHRGLGHDRRPRAGGRAATSRSEGESIEVDGHLLVAEKVQGRRVGSVRILRLEGPPLHAGARNPDEEWLAERAHRSAGREERSSARPVATGRPAGTGQPAGAGTGQPGGTGRPGRDAPGDGSEDGAEARLENDSRR